MKIINISKNKKKFYPIGIYNNKVICKEIDKNSPFEDSLWEAKDLWMHDIASNNMKKLTNENRIYYYEIYDKEVNGEDSLYYLIQQRQIHYNTYYLYRIDLENGNKEMLYSFDVYEKFEVQVIPLTKTCFLAFYKEEKYDFEMKMPIEKTALNHDEAYLFDIEEKKKYRVMDNNLVYGFKYSLFQAKIKNVMHLVFEEVYLDVWEKENIYKRANGHEKTKRIYTDSIKIIPLDKFINEVKEEQKKISFINLDSKGYDGITAYEAITKERLFYIIKDFKSDVEKLVALDRNSMIKKETIISYKHDEKALYDDVIYNLECDDKRILHQTFYQDKVYNKELVFGDKEFTYDFNLGRASNLLEGKYLITHFIKGHDHKKYTTIIDIEKNNHKKYLGESKVFNDKLVIY